MKNQHSFLLIDDEAVSNTLSEIQIKRIYEDATVVSYTDAQLALKDIMKDFSQFVKGSIMLLDVNMPFSGWNFLDSLKNANTDVANHFNIYLFSGLAEEYEHNKAKQYPIVKGVIEKPLTKQALASLLNR